MAEGIGAVAVSSAMIGNREVGTGEKAFIGIGSYRGLGCSLVFVCIRRKGVSQEHND